MSDFQPQKSLAHGLEQAKRVYLGPFDANQKPTWSCLALHSPKESDFLSYLIRPFDLCQIDSV